LRVEGFRSNIDKMESEYSTFPSERNLTFTTDRSVRLKPLMWPKEVCNREGWGQWVK
jgi:hypothetical protein